MCYQRHWVWGLVDGMHVVRKLVIPLYMSFRLGIDALFPLYLVVHIVVCDLRMGFAYALSPCAVTHCHRISALSRMLPEQVRAHTSVEEGVNS